MTEWNAVYDLRIDIYQGNSKPKPLEITLENHMPAESL